MHVNRTRKSSARFGMMLMGAAAGLLLVPALPVLAQPQPSRPQPRPKPQESPIQAARKALADAKKDLEDNSNELKRIHQNLEDELEGHDDFKAARAAVDKASKAYDEACKPVLAKVAADPVYVAAQKKHDDAVNKYHDLQGSDNPDTSELTQLSQDAFDASGVMKKMNLEALMSDPGAAAARKELDNKRRALDQLKRENEEQIKQNPDYLQAQQQIQPYLDKVKQAQDALDSLVKSQTHQPARPPVNPPPMIMPRQ